MTPEEKAHDLFDKFYKKVGFREQAKQCALIAVDEILSLPSKHDGRMIAVILEDYQYWQQVKTEIEKL